MCILSFTLNCTPFHPLGNLICTIYQIFNFGMNTLSRRIHSIWIIKIRHNFQITFSASLWVKLRMKLGMDCCSPGFLSSPSSSSSSARSSSTSPSSSCLRGNKLWEQPLTGGISATFKIPTEVVQRLMRGHVLFPCCVSTSTSALLIMHISYLGAAGCDRRTGVNKTFHAACCNGNVLFSTCLDDLKTSSFQTTR